MPNRPWHLPLLGIITLLGAALRAWPIATRPLWYDEVMTWKSVSASSFASIFFWRHHHEHPPLSYLLVKTSVWLFGSEAEWALRLPSLIAGVLCIPAAYLLGRVAVGRGVGLAAAAFAAFDLNGITQSQQARMYTLALLATLLASAAAIAALRRPVAWRWVLASLAAGLAFLANNSGLATLLVVPASAVLVMPVTRKDTHPRRQLVIGAAIALGVAVVLLLPGLPAVIDRIDWYGARSVEASILDRVRGLCFDFGHAYGGGVIAGTFVALGIIGLTSLFPKRNAAGGFLLLLFAVASLLLLPVEPHGFEPRPRYVMLAQAPLWIGFALMYARSRRTIAVGVATGTLLACWLGGLSLLEGKHWRYHYGATMRDLRTRVAPGDAVVFYPAWIEAVPWYYNLRPTHAPPPWGGASELAHQPLSGIDPARPTWLTIAYHLETGATDAAPDMIAAVADLYGVTFDPARAEEALRNHPIVIARIDAAGVAIEGHATPAAR